MVLLRLFDRLASVKMLVVQALPQHQRCGAFELRSEHDWYKKALHFIHSQSTLPIIPIIGVANNIDEATLLPTFVIFSSIMLDMDPGRVQQLRSDNKNITMMRQL